MYQVLPEYQVAFSQKIALRSGLRKKKMLSHTENHKALR
jgi:hypothetical protein